MKNRAGFTLIELFIVMMIVFVFISIFAVSVQNCNGTVQTDATATMRAYMTELYEQPEARIQCVRMDSDGDGYVSCTGVYNDAAGSAQTVNVECAYFLNAGCRVPKMRLPQ